MSSPNLDEDDLVLLNHATGDNTREECSWQDAHELLNSSVELLEVPGEYLKKTDSNNSRIVSKVTLVIPQTMASAEARTRHLPMAVRSQQPQPRKVTNINPPSGLRELPQPAGTSGTTPPG